MFATKLIYFQLGVETFKQENAELEYKGIKPGFLKRLTEDLLFIFQ